jgi:hypothetical protein
VGTALRACGIFEHFHPLYCPQRLFFSVDSRHPCLARRLKERPLPGIFLAVGRFRFGGFV